MQGRYAKANIKKVKGKGGDHVVLDKAFTERLLALQSTK